MIRLTILLLFCGLLFQCSSKKSVPRDVLPVKEMQAVLWDVMRSDQLVTYYKNKDSTLNTLSKQIELLDTIFSIHSITKKDFKKSLEFYQSRPDLLKIIFDSLQKKTTAPFGSSLAQ